MIKIRGNSIKIRIPHCFTSTFTGQLEAVGRMLDLEMKEVIARKWKKSTTWQVVVEVVVGLVVVGLGDVVVVVLVVVVVEVDCVGGWVSGRPSDGLPTGQEGHLPPEGGVPPPRSGRTPITPSVINKPAATRPDASDNSMTEATSMPLVTVDLLDDKEMYIQGSFVVNGKNK